MNADHVTPTQSGRAKTIIFTYLLSLIVFVLDQLSKLAILQHFKAFAECGPDSPYAAQSCDQPFMPFINFTMVWNHGVSMSMIQGGSSVTRWVITILTSIVALIVAWWISREKDKWQLAAYGLILGGALGNILDRIRYGAVVDFIRAHAQIMGTERSFWVFNVADAAITAGVMLLLLRSVAGSGKQDIHTSS